MTFEPGNKFGKGTGRPPGSPRAYADESRLLYRRGHNSSRGLRLAYIMEILLQEGEITQRELASRLFVTPAIAWDDTMALMKMGVVARAVRPNGSYVYSTAHKIGGRGKIDRALERVYPVDSIRRR